MGPCDAWEMGVVKACETAALMHCRNLSCHYVSFVRVPSAGSKTHADAIVFATGNSWTCAEDEIQPGITVIPGGAPQPPTPCCFFFVRGCVVCWKCESEPEVCRAGVSRASCAVLCPKGQAECNSGVIVFIPPVNCFETEIYHNTENAGTLPEGFEQVPLISFPYPSLVAPLKTFLCNFSPDKYYFYWGRIAGLPRSLLSPPFHRETLSRLRLSE